METTESIDRTSAGHAIQSPGLPGPSSCVTHAHNVTTGWRRLLLAVVFDLTDVRLLKPSECCAHYRVENLYLIPTPFYLEFRASCSVERSGAFKPHRVLPKINGPLSYPLELTPPALINPAANAVTKGLIVISVRSDGHLGKSNVATTSHTALQMGRGSLGARAELISPGASEPAEGTARGSRAAVMTPCCRTGRKGHKGLEVFAGARSAFEEPLVTARKQLSQLRPYPPPIRLWSDVISIDSSGKLARG
ncbi:hypothetical protein Bbelb_415430 [Branchiostoma belcheri]|nr:hypothetical protein Bbelb_415430 [Branchiostoma belcheri]